MAGNLFLFIDGVKGECVDSNHKDWIDVESVQYGVSSPQSAGYGGGSGVGSATYSDMTFSCRLDLAVPTLMNACSGNTHYTKGAKLHQCKMKDNKSYEFFEVILKDVTVTQVSISTQNNADPMASYSLAFSSISTKYWMQTQEGKKGVMTEAEWDQKKNVA